MFDLFTPHVCLVDAVFSRCGRRGYALFSLPVNSLLSATCDLTTPLFSPVSEYLFGVAGLRLCAPWSHWNSVVSRSFVGLRPVRLPYECPDVTASLLYWLPLFIHPCAESPLAPSPLSANHVALRIVSLTILRERQCASSLPPKLGYLFNLPMLATSPFGHESALNCRSRLAVGCDAGSTLECRRRGGDEFHSTHNLSLSCVISRAHLRVLRETFYDGHEHA